jgi:MATE family multidrug resistance protein
MSLVYMLAIGMAGATSIRVGKAVGMQNVKNTQVSGFVGLIVAAFLTLPFTFFAVFYPETIARIFFIDIEIINLTAQVLIIIGCLAVFDGMMAVTLGALRGTGDVWMPCVMQSIAFWLIGLPIAYYLSVNLEYGIIGLWYGLGSGIFISLLLLVPRFYMISSKPIVRL